MVLALAEAGAARVVVVARDRARAVATAELAGAAGEAATIDEAARIATSAELIVNATPVGMLGGPAEAQPALVPAALLGEGQVVSDLVYHPRVTSWLGEAASTRGTGVRGPRDAGPSGGDPAGALDRHGRAGRGDVAGGGGGRELPVSLTCARPTANVSARARTS